jgi:hypothetical protein
MTAHREFADAVARARPARTLAWELNLMSAKSGGQAQVAMFALKNVAPDEWRDVKHVETTNTQLLQLTDAQLMAIAAGNVGNLGEGVIEGEFTRADVQHPDERKADAGNGGLDPET